MKRNFTKILSLLLMLAVLCPIVSAMGVTANAASSDTIYVNNVAMKNGYYLRSNATTSSVTKPRNNFAYYSDGVLYIHNFSITWNGSSTSPGGINAGNGDLTISLSGTSNITINSSSDAAIVGKGMLTIRGSGTLTVENTAGFGINYSGGLTVEGGTLKVKSKNGVFLNQAGNAVISRGKLEVDSTAFGITCKNITVYGGTMDVVGSRQALMLGGKLTAASGLLVRGATSANKPPVVYDSASIYERVYVGDHECYGASATCQTPMKCSDCGRVFDVYADHSWTTFWDVTTAEGHAHKCKTNGCTAHSSFENHIPGAPATETSEQTCTTCGYIITPKLNHTHTTKKFAAVKATCEQSGNLEYYTCTVCSKAFQDSAATKEYTDLSAIITPATGHTYAEIWSTNETEHWHACTACGAKDIAEAHIPGEAATDTTDQICLVCAYVIKKAEAHTHAFGDHWFSDDSSHWHACACGEVSEKTAHEDTDGDQECDSCYRAVEAAVVTDPDEKTDGEEGSEKPEKPEKKEDDKGGISPVIIVVCILAVVFVAAGIVLIVLLAKRKKPVAVPPPAAEPAPAVEPAPTAENSNTEE